MVRTHLDLLHLEKDIVFSNCWENYTFRKTNRILLMFHSYHAENQSSLWIKSFSMILRQNNIVGYVLWKTKKNFVCEKFKIYEKQYI